MRLNCFHSHTFKLFCVNAFFAILVNMCVCAAEKLA